MTPLPWLSQGDIFLSVPIVHLRLSGTGLASDLQSGPGMLVSNDCALDKKTRSGQATIKKLSFLPLRSAAALPADRAALLRRDEIQPYEALYLGRVPSAGEAYVMVSEVYTLPAEYFGVNISEFNDVPDAQSVGSYLVATREFERMGRLGTDRLELLKTKWNAHWTRRIPPPG